MKAPKIANKTILLAMLLVIFVSAIGDMKRRNVRTPAPKILIGGFAVTIILLVASEFIDDIPEGFALLMMVATLIGPNGEEVWNVIKKVSTEDRPSVPTPSNIVIES